MGARTVACLVAAATLATGCAAGAGAEAVSAPAASCKEQVHAWQHAGGLLLVNSVMDDLAAVGDSEAALASDITGGADTSADVVSIQSMAVQLQTSVTGAESGPPPACSARATADIAAGLSGAQAITASAPAAGERAAKDHDADAMTKAAGLLTQPEHQLATGVSEMGQ